MHEGIISQILLNLNDVFSFLKKLKNRQDIKKTFHLEEQQFKAIVKESTENPLFIQNEVEFYLRSTVLIPPGIVSVEAIQIHSKVFNV